MEVNLSSEMIDKILKLATERAMDLKFQKIKLSKATDNERSESNSGLAYVKERNNKIDKQLADANEVIELFKELKQLV